MPSRFDWWIFGQLNRIESQLDRIEGRQVADEQQLDDALTELGQGIDEMQAAVQSLVDKASAANIDLTDELDTISNFRDRISQAAQQAKDAAGTDTAEVPPADTSTGETTTSPEESV